MKVKNKKGILKSIEKKYFNNINQGYIKGNFYHEFKSEFIKEQVVEIEKCLLEWVNDLNKKHHFQIKERRDSNGNYEIEFKNNKLLVKSNLNITSFGVAFQFFKEGDFICEEKYIPSYHCSRLDQKKFIWRNKKSECFSSEQIANNQIDMFFQKSL